MFGISSRSLHSSFFSPTFHADTTSPTDLHETSEVLLTLRTNNDVTESGDSQSEKLSPVKREASSVDRWKQFVSSAVTGCNALVSQGCQGYRAPLFVFSLLQERFFAALSKISQDSKDLHLPLFRTGQTKGNTFDSVYNIDLVALVLLQALRRGNTPNCVITSLQREGEKKNVHDIAEIIRCGKDITSRSLVDRRNSHHAKSTSRFALRGHYTENSAGSCYAKVDGPLTAGICPK